MRARRAATVFSQIPPDALELPPPQPDEVSLEGITAAYGRHVVVSNLSLTLAPGTTLSIIGPSGCGKTTLLRSVGHLGGDDLHIAGTVRVGGIARSEPGTWMGVVFQDSPVFEYMTVWDNVMFGNIAKEGVAWRLLSDFGLAQLAAMRASTLSGGQRQRLAVAIALANRPQLLLLDEPFGALDAITRRQLQTFYRTHVRGKVTALFVTHDLTEALLVGNEISIGVGPDRKLLAVDGSVSSSGEWEFTSRFGELKRNVFTELERISNDEKVQSS
jgi:ABC-type nitrate/sulfonate/bicarbonate transport system ATPase subunit